MSQIKIYSDLNHNLRTEYVYNVDSIKQSIQTILTTRKGTRVFNAEFGCDLNKYLFELMDDITAYLLFNEVVSALTRWEPRIAIVQSQSSIVADPLNKIYWLTLAFEIKNNPSEIHKYEIGIQK